MNRRKKDTEAVYHIYQQSQEGGLLFYSHSDYLVFFTAFCALARKTGQHILALCPMPDHIHHVEVAGIGAPISDFVQQYTQQFAYQWNQFRQRKGPLFKPYGSALKLGSKQIRTTLAYNYNNPVERKLVPMAEEYRWNFLPYAQQPSPFSPVLIRRKLHRPLLRILSEADACFAQGKGLNYAQLHRWKSKLSPVEQQQLSDYIIGLWNVIDYNTAARYYGSIETMIRAFRDNTGSEHDITEDRDNYSDTVYADCTRLLLQEKYINDVYEIPLLPPEKKEQIYELLTYRTTARPKQICKYLHLPAWSARSSAHLSK